MQAVRVVAVRCNICTACTTLVHPSWVHPVRCWVHFSGCTHSDETKGYAWIKPVDRFCKQHVVFYIHVHVSFCTSVLFCM